MQNILLNLVLNGMMACLLLATIIYCLKLNSRIRILQDSKSELARIIREFDESTTRATASIAEIHQATTRISENIQHKIDKANFLADDLQYMIEKGNKLQGREEPAPQRLSRSPVAPAMAASPQQRSAPTPAAAQAPQTAEMTDVATPPGQPARRPLRMRSRAEQELMSVLGTKNTGESNR